MKRRERELSNIIIANNGTGNYEKVEKTRSFFAKVKAGEKKKK